MHEEGEGRMSRVMARNTHRNAGTWACRFRVCNIAIVWEKLAASAAALSLALLWAVAAALSLALLWAVAAALPLALLWAVAAAFALAAALKSAATFAS